MIKLPRLSLPRLKLSPVTATLLVAGMLVALAAGASYYFYRESKRVTGLLENPTEAARVEVRSMVARVGRLMVLPTDEEPTLATVIDPAKLADQPFFKSAKSGDKVLIYTTNRKAILYRPGENKILEVAPITIGQGQAPGEAVANQPADQAAEPPPPTPTGGKVTLPVRLVLYNGTQTVGATKIVEETLTKRFEELIIVNRDNASKRDYDETIIVDLVGSKRDAAQKIAAALGGEMGALPEGEHAPEASPAGSIDLLVIVGKNAPL